MTSNTEKVQPLHHIAVDIQIGSTAEKMDLTSSPIRYEFIYGVSTEGMTPFEYAIADSKIGDEIKTTVKKEEAAEFFSQFEDILPGIQPIPDALYLTINIRGVKKAENRDIIKAMAGGTECGCGCGGHGQGGHGHCDEKGCKDHGSGHCRC